MKLHPTIAELVRDIDAFIEQRGITQTEFGVLSIGDPNLYRHLKHGRNPRLATMDRIRSFMRKREGAAA
jgi:predicted transcriptional regulator